MDLVKYDGRMVPKEHFRAFVYGVNNARKIVNSWDEFEAAIQGDYWFEKPQMNMPIRSKRGKNGDSTRVRKTSLPLDQSK